MSDLVVLSLEVWDDVWRRNQHLVANMLADGSVRRVLFVEPPVDPLHSLLNRHRPDLGKAALRAIDVPDADSGQLWAYRPRKWLPRRVDRGGDQRRSRQVGRVANRLGLVDPVLWVNDPVGAEVLKEKDWPALYDITDDWLLADRSAAELARLTSHEAKLLERCREVVVCSPSLQRSKSAKRKVTLIPNAVDVDAYRTLQPRPTDLPAGATAVYLGTVHRDRIDLDLCEETARYLKSSGTSEVAQVVLVGPAPLTDADMGRLKRAGVRVLGPRPSYSVPAYLQHADVLIVPHRVTEFTASLDPIKAYEYRAAGRKVVATKVPGFVDSKDPKVSCVDSADFPAAVGRAVQHSQPWSSVSLKDIPSWQDRASAMAQIVSRVRGGSAPNA